MKSQQTEGLLRDLLHITTRECDRLSKVLAENFDLLNEAIVRILREEYEKPKNDWRILCGCFSVILEASMKYDRIFSGSLRNTYPLINKGLLDRHISVKKFAARLGLHMIGRVYLEREFLRLGGGDDGKEIGAEIRELKKNIKSVVFLESLDSVFPRPLDKKQACDVSDAGITEKDLVEVSRSILG